MRIPFSISNADLDEAIRQIDANDVPPRRQSTGYDLHFNHKKYPPKYVVKLAYESAHGSELKGVKVKPRAMFQHSEHRSCCPITAHFVTA
jgi:hypothetical protein